MRNAHVDEEDDCSGIAVGGSPKDGAHGAAQPDSLWGVHRILQQHLCVHDPGIAVRVVHPAPQSWPLKPQALRLKVICCTMPFA